MVMRTVMSRLGWNEYRSHRAYDRYLSRMLREHRGNRRLALALAVGSISIDLFDQQGDGHVALLKYHGLADGMSIFDLGCGCGRTAQALQRSGWQGSYTGTDILKRFVIELRDQCPDYQAFVHRTASIPMPDASLDMLYHWSVFTHLSPEECFLYLEDTFRALKPGGKTVFSFLELADSEHQDLFYRRVAAVRNGRPMPLLDTFIHRDWITCWAHKIGFEEPVFTDGFDTTNHGAFWQALVALRKPAA